MTCKTQPFRHIEAHLAESNDSQFHEVPFLCGLYAELSQLIAELRGRLK
jgi:hypothetical protein